MGEVQGLPGYHGPTPIMDDIRHCSFSARLDCHYLLRAPETLDSQTLLVVTLHGFSSNPEVMLRLTETMFGPRHAIAALQGPNQFYLGMNNPDVGYGWATNRQAAGSIRLHHEMVQHVLNEAGRAYGIPPERCLLAGFSQPVSFNYRFAATYPAAVRGVIALCGGLPSDWETASYQPVTAAVLHIARSADEYYPPEVTEKYPDRLKTRAGDVEFHLLDGGHRFPSKGKPIVENWLRRIL
jgi:predicted esterase